MFEYGLSIYWAVPADATDTEQRAHRVLDYAQSLGANAVSVSFPVYTDGPHPSKVFAGADTPSPEQLVTLVRLAKSRGLRVTVTPLVDEANLAAAGAWRGTIEPPDVPRWFGEYRSFEKNYLQALGPAGLDEFDIGASLTSLERYTLEWSETRDELRSTGFTGDLTYAYNYWPADGNVPVDSSGIFAYPPVELGDDATVFQLASALVKWIHALPANMQENLTIENAGIAASAGMYRTPWASGTTADAPQVQANWFEAMIWAAQRTGTRGIYFGMVDSSFDPNNPPSDPTSFVNRPAQEILKKYYGP